SFEPGRGHEVKLFLQDQRGCINQNSAIVRVRSSVNPIRGVTPLPDVCSGTPVELNVGYTAGSDVLVEPIVSTQQYSLGFDSTMYVPDGPNCSVLCYSTNVTFTEFGPTQKISSINDIISICFTMEHSFLGDLQFKLVCPNGQSTTMHGYRNNGSNTNNGIDLGISVSGSSPGCVGDPTKAGTGWNYCWSENTTLGFQYHGSSPHYIYLDPTTTARCDSTNRQNNTNYYRPFNSFSSLIGCPLNGVWAIEICDNWGIDDGWIFGWQLTLDPSLLPQAWTYSVFVDEVLWSGPMITSTSDTTAIIQTPEAGIFDYTFTVIDDFGCAYDSSTTLTVIQSPIFDLGEDISVCEGVLFQVDPNYNVPGAVYAWSDYTNDPLLTTTVPGEYCLTITQSNENISCQSTDCINININPQPTADFTAVPTEGCSPLLVNFNDLSGPAESTLSYFWDFGDPNTSQNTSNEANPNHIFANYGSYDVTLRVVTEHGCENEITKPGFITVHATPIANFIPSQSEVSLADNPTVIFTNTTENYSPSETSWTWSFGDGNGSAEHSPTHEYTDPDDYSVVLIVTTDKGCGDTVSRLIIVEDDIFIPNIITPDGDGKNDVLFIGNINPQRVNTLKIYNRWGKKVYDQTNYKTRARCKNLGDNAWDCSDYQDSDLGWGNQGNAEGVYYYVFTYQGVTKEVVRNGTITVIGRK
ncbi:MAG: PKD domain-containing protein, partial [Bacteroidales bacterium]|nr:PKD domain-containing protein [Bacteroidales bacterium]